MFQDSNLYKLVLFFEIMDYEIGWRGRTLLVEARGKGSGRHCHVPGWKTNGEPEPLEKRFQRNCRAFLNGCSQLRGDLSKISFIGAPKPSSRRKPMGCFVKKHRYKRYNHDLREIWDIREPAIERTGRIIYSASWDFLREVV